MTDATGGTHGGDAAQGRAESRADGAAAPLRIAVVGAGPAGLALALAAARGLPTAEVSLHDARPLEKDVSADPRTLALALGSVQTLQRLGAFDDGAEPIRAVHVSQQAPTLSMWRGPSARQREPELALRAADLGVPQLGAVRAYGGIVAPLQRAWLAAAAAEPARLHTRFGAAVAAIKTVGDEVEVDAGIVERHDIAVIAEGGVFQPRAAEGGASHAPRHAADGAAPALVDVTTRPPLRHDYRQTAWVGQVWFDDPQGLAGTAYERFTRHGPAALLPLPGGRAGLVWCVATDDDPVAGLDDAQRLLVLQSLFHPRTPHLAGVTPLKRFPLGLSAERTLVTGRVVRIGNAAQTLHPVAGQGLNLGLRDAEVMVQALARATRGDVPRALAKVEWQRAPDRWAMIATTDFLARSFTWTLPGAATARGLGLAALDALGPLKALLAKRMMFGSR